MKRIEQAARALRDLLEINFEINIELTNNSDYYGAHYPVWQITSNKPIPIHSIKLSTTYNKTTNDYIDTLAHEMIHAKQWEVGANRKKHGKYFFKNVKYLKHFGYNAGMAK